MTTVTERLRAAWRGLTTPLSEADPLTRGQFTKAARPSSRDVRLWPNYRNATPLWTMVDIQSFIDSGFNLNAVIYAACMYRADAVNTAQLRGYSGNQDNPEPLPPTDDVAALLQRPNRFQSAQEFHAMNSVFFSVAGQSYIWFKRERANATPVEMYTLRPDWVHIVPDSDSNGELVGYVYTPTGMALADGYPLVPEDVMHVKRPNPGDPLMGAGYGFSPLGPAAQSANVDNDVTRFLKMFFQEGAMFQNMIAFEGQHDPKQLAEVREKLKARYGGVDKWGEWAVFDSSATVTRMSPTFEEMGFDGIDSRNEARILMTLGVPPILVGARLGLERSTFSNYEEARKQFWEDRLLPELRMFESEYNYFLGSDARLVKYDLSDVPALRKDLPSLTQAARDLVDMGTPPRLAYMTVGLEVPAYPGDMERYINMGGGSVLTPAEATATAEEAAQMVEDSVTTDTTKSRTVKAYDARAMGRKVDALATDWEQRYGDAANAVFAEELRTLQAMVNETQKAAYRQKATPNWTVLTQTVEEWYAENAGEDWRSTFVPLIEGTMLEAGEEWATALGVAFDVRNLQAEAWFQEYVLQFADPITQTSSDAVKALLAQAQAEGWTMAETEKRLELLFDQWMEGNLSAEDFEWFEQRLPAYRRENIARTETISASNQGTFNLGKSWGASKKFWIDTEDSRTRDSHRAAGLTYTEQNAIPIDQPFIVGGNNMNAPGDPSAPVGERAQCRCALGLLMD